MNTKILVLSLLSILTLTGCSFGNTNNSNGSDETGDNNNNSDNNNNNNNNDDSGDTDNNDNNNNNDDDNGGDNKEEDKFAGEDTISNFTFEDFFNPTSKIEISLDFSNESLYKLAQYGTSRNFDKEEMYHPCNVTVTVNGNTSIYKEVGARMKGNTSRNNGFISENGIFTDKVSLCHFKLSFSTLFNKTSKNDYYIKTYTEEEKAYRDDRRLVGLKKIDLKWNRTFDKSFTKELYSLQSFRDVGVYSQHANLINLTINTEADSVTQNYLAYEVVDKTMIKSVFTDKAAQKGDLYKCTYSNQGPADLASTDNNKFGLESNGYTPSYCIKTNEDTSDYSSIKSFISLSSVRNTSGEEYKEVIDNILDIDYFLRFAAMSWIIGSPDDYRNNYNNYYLYFNPSNNKAYFIPYDNDRVLGILNGWEIDTSHQAMDSDRLGGTATNDGCGMPIVRRLLAPGSTSRPMVEEYYQKYLSYCKEYATTYLDVNKFKDYTNQFYYSSKDISEGNNNMSFETYANNKKSTF